MHGIPDTPTEKQVERRLGGGAVRISAGEIIMTGERIPGGEKAMAEEKKFPELSIYRRRSPLRIFFTEEIL